jgi:hypothetical protein
MLSHIFGLFSNLYLRNTKHAFEAQKRSFAYCSALGCLECHSDPTGVIGFNYDWVSKRLSSIGPRRVGSSLGTSERIRVRSCSGWVNNKQTWRVTRDRFNTTLQPSSRHFCCSYIQARFRFEPYQSWRYLCDQRPFSRVLRLVLSALAYCSQE